MSTYEKLLERLKINAVDNDETALQRTLLNRLIHLETHVKKPAAALSEPKDTARFKALARTAAQIALSHAADEKHLETLQKKAKVLAEEIGNRDENTPDLFTLQLQYAFYRRSIHIYQQQIVTYKKTLEQAARLLAAATQKLNFHPESSAKTLEKALNTLNTIERRIENLQIDKERLTLLAHRDAIKKINDRIKALELEREQIYSHILLARFMLFSAALHARDTSKVFTLQKQLLADVTKAYDPVAVADIASVMRTMEHSRLGKITSLEGATSQEIKSAFALFWKEANAPLFTIGKTSISLFKLTLALLVFIIGFIMGGVYKRSIKRLGSDSDTLTQSTRTLVSNLGYYLIVIIAFFIALKVLGINLSSIALVAGALSVGIGFGLQNVVSNFVSGLILMFERSIKIGDYLELDDTLRGRVSDIRMRSTTISTNDNIDVIVPNQQLIQNRVVNWTMEDEIRRFEIPFSVAYGTPVDRVRDAVLHALAHAKMNDVYTSRRRISEIVMTGMGDSSVDFKLFVWIKGRAIFYPQRTASRFLILIYEALNEAGIEIPFPQRDLHIRSVDGHTVFTLREQKGPDNV